MDGPTGVVRIDAAGEIDEDFAGDGRAEVDAGGPVLPVEIARDGDGMLVAGTTGGARDFALARLTSAGALDSSYGSGGHAIADFGGREDALTGLVALPGGGAVAFGTSRPVGGGADELALARYDASGTLDPAFGDGGLARIPLDVVPPELEVVQAPEPYGVTGASITVQANSSGAPVDGRIVAARPWRPRLRFPRSVPALARGAGRRELRVRVTITLADPGAELVTRRFRVRVR